VSEWVTKWCNVVRTLCNVTKSAEEVSVDRSTARTMFDVQPEERPPGLILVLTAVGWHQPL
jgi:hypothetical protein